MKTTNIFKVAVVLIAAIGMLSCSSSRIVPKAINTVNSVRFDELNLERKDYTIINTLTADATIKYRERGSSIIIEEINSEFMLRFDEPKKSLFGSKQEGMILGDFEGVVRLGCLNNDYAGMRIDYGSPEDLGRRLAIYRLINLAKEQGADGVIEPLVSTNVEQVGKEIIFVTTVSAKCVKLKVK